MCAESHGLRPQMGLSPTFNSNLTFNHAAQDWCVICTEKFHDFEKTTRRTQQNGDEAAKKAFEKSKEEIQVDDNGEESDL